MRFYWLLPEVIQERSPEGPAGSTVNSDIYFLSIHSLGFPQSLYFLFSLKATTTKKKKKKTSWLVQVHLMTIMFYVILCLGLRQMMREKKINQRAESNVSDTKWMRL